MEQQLANLTRKREAIQLRWQIAVTAVNRVDTRHPIQNLEAQLLKTNFHALYKQLFRYNRILGMLPGTVVNPGQAPVGMLPFTPPRAGGPLVLPQPPQPPIMRGHQGRQDRPRRSPWSPSMSPIGLRNRASPAPQRPLPLILEESSPEHQALAGVQVMPADPLQLSPDAIHRDERDDNSEISSFEAEFESDLEV